MTKGEFKRLRAKVGTQARIAGLMGVHVGTVIAWESGARVIPPARAEEIKRLARQPVGDRAGVTAVLFEEITPAWEEFARALQRAMNRVFDDSIDKARKSQ